MAHPPPYPERDDSEMAPNRESTGDARRWISAAGIIVALILILIVVILHLSGVIGPGSH